MMKVWQGLLYEGFPLSFEANALPLTFLPQIFSLSDHSNIQAIAKIPI